MPDDPWDETEAALARRAASSAAWGYAVAGLVMLAAFCFCAWQAAHIAIDFTNDITGQ
jgi:hypothetical protein